MARKPIAAIFPVSFYQLSRLLAVVVIVSCTTSLVGNHSPSELERVLTSGKLTILSRNGSTTYYEGRSGYTGFEYTLTKAFADKLGVELVIADEEDIGKILELVKLPDPLRQYSKVMTTTFIENRSSAKAMSVSALNRQVKRMLEVSYGQIWVSGEISGLSCPRSGHWYFTLKDSKAQLRSAMFRNRNQRVRFAPRNGLQVLVRGKISLYEARGEYQFIAEQMEEAGEGALRRAFDELRLRLQQEGLFANELKKPIPKLANHLAIFQ